MPGHTCEIKKDTQGLAVTSIVALIPPEITICLQGACLHANKTKKSTTKCKVWVAV